MNATMETVGARIKRSLHKAAFWLLYSRVQGSKMFKLQPWQELLISLGPQGSPVLTIKLKTEGGEPQYFDVTGHVAEKTVKGMIAYSGHRIFVVGKNDDCDLVVKVDSVSNFHATLDFNRGNVIVFDGGLYPQGMSSVMRASKNGLFVALVTISRS